MNYIIEIKAFYDTILSTPLSTGQIALWHALMHVNNKCGWIEWFTAPNRTLEMLTGLSRQGIDKNRTVLKELRLIDFKSNGTEATIYTMKSLQGSLQNSGTLTKLNETIPDQTKPSPDEFEQAYEMREKKRKETDKNNEDCKAYYHEILGINADEELPIIVKSAILKSIVNGIEPELIKCVIDIAANKEKPPAYLKTTLENLIADGVNTLELYERKYGAPVKSNSRSAEKIQQGSFDTDTFFAASLQATYRQLGKELTDEELTQMINS